MRIFELHFNPRAKSETAEQIFDSFCYSPENIYEKKVGSLYMVGELQNLLPQNLRLLNNLSQVIKGKFYAAPLRSPDKAFEEGLKKANEFLGGEVSKDNVSWLGNLNFAVLNLIPRNFLSKQALPKGLNKNWWQINCTKVGTLKVLLLTNNQIIDIGKNLDFEEIEPYPVKIFTNTVSGKLSFGDKIIILTKEVFDFLSKNNLLNEFIKVDSFDERKIREILERKKKELFEISGIFLFIDTAQELSEKPRIVNFQKELEKFSLKEVFTPLVEEINLFFTLIAIRVIKILIRSRIRLKKYLDRSLASVAHFQNKTLSNLEKIFHFPKITPKLKTELPLPKVEKKEFSLIMEAKVKKRTKSSSPIKNQRLSFNPLAFKPRIKITEGLKNNLVLVLVFLFFITAGFFIFQGAEKKQLKEMEKTLAGAQEKIFEAENFLIFKDEQRANILFKEAWEDILPLTKEESPLMDRAISLKNSVEINLKNLSKLEVISDPKPFFEFDPKEFIPQKMVYSDGNLYFFSPFSDKLSKINLQDKNKSFYSFPSGKDEEISLAAVSDDSILFFSKPGKIIVFKKDGFSESFSLNPPYSDFNFVSFSSYQKNIYFLDKTKGEIIKYLSLLEKGKESPQLWLNSQTKKATDSKSMAIDGSIWILSENNTISRYHNGQYQDDLIFDIFPASKRLYKIFTLPNLPYLYILEPVQNRIIILEKTGEIFKQFQIEKFENLKDFAVSENGKAIYLLNDQAVYRINL